ncbi:MAG: hypothetical protein DMG03_20535, partial [Acidobacteria bacterium]
DLTNGLTIEAWVNPMSGTGTRTVLMKETFSALAYALYSAVSGQRPVGYVHTTKKTESAVGSTAVPLNTWTHLALTFDDSTLRLYMNGTLIRSSNTNSASIVTGTGALRIGGRHHRRSARLQPRADRCRHPGGHEYADSVIEASASASTCNRDNPKTTKIREDDDLARSVFFVFFVSLRGDSSRVRAARSLTRRV